MRHIDQSRWTHDVDGSMHVRGAEGAARVKFEPDGHMSEVEWSTPLGTVIVHLHRRTPAGDQPVPSLEIRAAEKRSTDR
jgi:hypothetical protein